MTKKKKPSKDVAIGDIKGTLHLTEVGPDMLTRFEGLQRKCEWGLATAEDVAERDALREKLVTLK